ncbi:carbonic anhydrase family protein [Weissella diestrammenae]|uniref:Carbonic anhydrase n=1 Tax=Weissella diestrammenae TaxID=1162633 RepID=A0A7G9T5I6_9LACO|nr:carbonic anhydrase family protein [Weissella diestrammenae]MCM0582184.1 carbonic anhydrase family protein [Weissella diestrammenae]QNN75361.1 carbonic anhydrase family protein [Weissella diestrammenae]
MRHINYEKQDDWYADTDWQSPIALSKVDNVIQKLSKSQISLTFPTEQAFAFEEWEIGRQYFADGKLLYKDKTYNLVRFHFHDGSEHCIDSEFFSAEVHFVFRCEEDTLVFAIFLEATSKFQKHDISDVICKNTKILNLGIFLPKNFDYFEYVGTLTTPPLMRDIQTVVLSTPVVISNQDKQAIHQLFPNNHRQTQSLNKRPVYFYSTE